MYVRPCVMRVMLLSRLVVLFMRAALEIAKLPSKLNSSPLLWRWRWAVLTFFARLWSGGSACAASG